MKTTYEVFRQTAGSSNRPRFRIKYVQRTDAGELHSVGLLFATYDTEADAEKALPFYITIPRDPSAQ